MEQLIAQGRRGTITRTLVDGKLIAKKIAINSETKGAITKEQEILRYLGKQNINFIPKLIETGDDRFSYERIPWDHFKTVYRSANEIEKKALVQKLLDAAHALDKVGVVHGELHKPFTNVLVDTTHENRLSIIDFERGTLQDFSGKNLRSVAQRLGYEGYITLHERKKVGEFNANEIHAFLSEKIARRSLPKWSRSKLYFFVFSLLIIDQLSKYFFFNLSYAESLRFITPVLNTWIGWSLPLPLDLVSIITWLVIVWIVIAWRRHRLPFVPTILLLSGAIGNAIDRLIYLGVRDFIDLHYWPIFNGADIYLTIAILLLIYSTMRNRHGLGT